MIPILQSDRQQHRISQIFDEQRAREMREPLRTHLPQSGEKTAAVRDDPVLAPCLVEKGEKMALTEQEQPIGLRTAKKS